MAQPIDETQNHIPMKTTITVQNLKCGGCAKTITSGISQIEGIAEVQVDVDRSAVSFEFAGEDVLSAATAKLKSLGYPSIEDENSFLDKTKSFVSCATGKMKA